MNPLNLSTVCGGTATAPNYDPRTASVGIVHIGLGGFHRGHQAAYVDDILGRDPSWGICAIAPRNPATARALRQQDGLYTLWSRGHEDSLRVIGSIRDTLCAAEDPRAVIQRLADPAVRLVTLTVTEKAYRSDQTVIRLLARGLQARAHDDAPLTVMSCDNLAGNGDFLKALLRDYCALLPAPEGTRLAEWLSERVTFPSTVVDRIVPAITPADRERLSTRLGLRDDAAVLAEPFGQWIIEDTFAAGRPPWTSPDVRLVRDAGPFERLKLRVVNGAHSALAYLGLLTGYDDVPSACADADLAAAVSRLLDEDVLPTLGDVPESAVADYRTTVLDRFANPAIRYPLRQVGADGSQKLPQRLVPIAVEHARSGRRSPWVALAVAAWMRWVHRCATDHPEHLVDPAADSLLSAASRAVNPAMLVAELISIEGVFGHELPQHHVFRDDLESWLKELWTAQPAGAIRAAIHA